MRLARIAELLQPFLHDASDPQPAAAPDALYRDISTYIDILLRWNARVNLTAIRDPEEIVTRHFGESLFAARNLFPGSERRGETIWGGTIRGEIIKNSSAYSATKDFDSSVADLGSGAGFPGIPIKLWATSIRLSLIESNHKKAAFLREVARALTLTNIDIQNARAEAVPQTFDVVTLRAIEHFDHVLPVAGRLTAPGGRLLLLLGASQFEVTVSTLTKFSWQRPIPVPLSQSRVLLLGSRFPTS
ncbi:MAG: 16S rRNA (guanine(527)-N(7))-methyltransferase RsmG [Candidatus Sulfotelmatobacter sp.]